MPPKVRDLIAELEQAGYAYESCKGSHRVYRHPATGDHVSVSGKAGADAHHYQVKQVKIAIEKVKR